MVRLTKDEITQACIEASTLLPLAAPFGRLWYDGPNAASNAIGYAKFPSRSHDTLIRDYDEAGNVIKTHEHAGTEMIVCVAVNPSDVARLLDYSV